MLDIDDARIHSLGPCRIESPMRHLLGGEGTPHFVEDTERVRVDDRLAIGDARAPASDEPVGFELAGPRARIYFEPAKLRCGIVTCGGLCPGINDVIRGLVMSLWHRYGVRQIVGFRYGLRGFISGYRHATIDLGPPQVSDIHQTGGTILGSSRGRQDIGEIVDCLERMNLRVLFVVGGGGTMQAAVSLVTEIAERGLKIAVVGIPKAIDNDLMHIDQSFGFQTAYAEAVESIRTAHVEAMGAPCGVALVKLMGRQSGFIACHATLASGAVNATLIPEVPFRLDGEQGLLRTLERRLHNRGHAVLVVAEGAGQDLMGRSVPPDPPSESGDAAQRDVGGFLSRAIVQHFAAKGVELNLKLLDPSYEIRSVPATAAESIYCVRLAQNAVHAALCGKTEMVVGQWHGSLVHVPMALTASGRRKVDPCDDLWLSVLEDTGQPVSMR